MPGAGGGHEEGEETRRKCADGAFESPGGWAGRLAGGWGYKSGLENGWALAERAGVGAQGSRFVFGFRRLRFHFAMSQQCGKKCTK